MAYLDVRHVSFGYAHKTPFEVMALKDVSFSVERGECICVIGHTGSGKSTLMQMLNALLKPESGEILLDGMNIHQNKKTACRTRFRVGLCFQYPEYQLFGETCEADIGFGPKNMGLSDEEIKKRVDHAADVVGLSSQQLRMSPFDLSGGQKRRCAIAGVLAMEPEILILDEPTAGLDPSGRKEILSLIRRYRRETNTTVFLVTHSMEIAQSEADRIMVLDRGSLAMFGTPAEIFKQADRLETMGLSIPSYAKVILALQKAGVPVETADSPQHAADAIAGALLKGGTG